VFKCQTLTFNLSTYRQSSYRLRHLSHHTPVRLRPYERIDCCDGCVGRRNNTATRSFLVNIFSTNSKFLIPNMYCWFRKI